MERGRRPRARFAAAHSGGLGAPPPANKSRCEELADGEPGTAHEKRGPRSEIAELERRRAIRALSCGFAARRLARKGRPLRPKALRPPSPQPSAAKTRRENAGGCLKRKRLFEFTFPLPVGERVRVRGNGNRRFDRSCPLTRLASHADLSPPGRGEEVPLHGLPGERAAQNLPGCSGGWLHRNRRLEYELGKAVSCDS